MAQPPYPLPDNLRRVLQLLSEPGRPELTVAKLAQTFCWPHEMAKSALDQLSNLGLVLPVKGKTQKWKAA